MDTTGAILGPLTAYFILKHLSDGFDAVFLLAFGTGLFALVSLLFVTEIAQTVTPTHSPMGSTDHLSAQFKRYLVSVFMLSAGSLPIAVLLLKTESIGLTAYSIPLFYMIYNLSYAGFSLTAGRLSDQLGTSRLIIAGYVMLIFGYVALYFAASELALVGSFLVLGLFPAFTDGVQRSHAAKLTSEEQRGKAYGLVNSMSGVGFMVAGIGGGYLWQAKDPGIALFNWRDHSKPRPIRVYSQFVNLLQPVVG